MLKVDKKHSQESNNTRIHIYISVIELKALLGVLILNEDMKSSGGNIYGLPYKAKASLPRDKFKVIYTCISDMMICTRAARKC